MRSVRSVGYLTRTTLGNPLPLPLGTFLIKLEIQAGSEPSRYHISHSAPHSFSNSKEHWRKTSMPLPKNGPSLPCRPVSGRGMSRNSECRQGLVSFQALIDNIRISTSFSVVTLGNLPHLSCNHCILFFCGLGPVSEDLVVLLRDFFHFVFLSVAFFLVNFGSSKRKTSTYSHWRTRNGTFLHPVA